MTHAAHRGINTIPLVFVALAAVVAPLKAQDQAPTPAREPRILLYAFQHYILREAAFDNHPDIETLISAPLDKGILIRFFGRTLFRVRQAEGVGEQFERVSEFVDAMTLEVQRRDGYTIAVLAMPPPEVPPEAHYIAIVYKDDEPREFGTPSPSTRYFTFELAAGDQQYALGEWQSSGEHKTIGVAQGRPSAEGLIANVSAQLGLR